MSGIVVRTPAVMHSCFSPGVKGTGRVVGCGTRPCSSDLWFDHPDFPLLYCHLSSAVFRSFLLSPDLLQVSSFLSPAAPCWLPWFSPGRAKRSKILSVILQHFSLKKTVWCCSLLEFQYIILGILRKSLSKHIFVWFLTPVRWNNERSSDVRCFPLVCHVVSSHIKH